MNGDYNIKNNNKLNDFNYIIKYYSKKDNNNLSYLFNKEFKLEKSNTEEKEINLEDKKYIVCKYNLIVKIKVQNINLSKCNITYFLKIYPINDKLKEENLNTIATIKSDICEKYPPISISNINEEKIFNLNELIINENYTASFFIKINNSENIDEEYYSLSYDFLAYENKKSYSNKVIIILCCTFLFIIKIIIIIFFIICKKFRKKNQTLEEKVKAISFSTGKEDSFESNSKNDEDYENTFI